MVHFTNSNGEVFDVYWAYIWLCNIKQPFKSMFLIICVMIDSVSCHGKIKECQGHLLIVAQLYKL